MRVPWANVGGGTAGPARACRDPSQMLDIIRFIARCRHRARNAVERLTVCASMAARSMADFRWLQARGGFGRRDTGSFAGVTRVGSRHRAGQVDHQVVSLDLD